MQLVAYGAQDIYLTGNPQITFFKVVYRRHTNFSMEAVAQTFSGNQNVGARVSSTISRNGDLISKMYYEYNPSVICPNAGTIVSHLGHALFNEIELEIGGQKIDKHYGHWLTVWNTLTEPNEGSFLNLLINNGAESLLQTRYTKMAYTHGGIGGGATTAQAPVKAFVPFQFWFNRNPGLALPLIALQYHEVKVNITFSNAASLSGNAAGGVIDPNGQLWVDYIYLDTDERRRFAQQSHEYLIEQLQFQQAAGANSIELNFNHPVKEIIWTGQPNALPAALQGVATPPGAGGAGIVSTAAGGNTNDTYQLKLNGHDRFAARHPFYFSRTQVYQHHSGSGLIGSGGLAAGAGADDRIAVYSFALKPEEHQPSGTCNFSRIDNARLNCNIANGNPPLNIYAVNYNVLRIMSGMGGLAYSN